MAPTTDAIDTTLMDAIQAFFVSATGLAGAKVIWLKPNIKRPAVPYVGLNVISGPRPIGMAETLYKELDTYNFPMRHEITLSVNSYADSGWLTTIQKAINARELPTKRAILRAAGVSIVNIADPLDVSALLNDQFEGRGAVDFILSYGTLETDVSGEIESVKIDQTVGTFDSTQTIN